MSNAQNQLGRATVEAHAAQSSLDQMRPFFDDLEAEYVRRWRNSEHSQQTTREDAWLMLRALDELRSHLAVKAKGGAVAAFNLRRHLAKPVT